MTATIGPPRSGDPGASILHRVNPVVKLAWLVAAVVVAFVAYHPVPLFAIGIGGLLIGVAAGVGGRIVRVLLIFAPVTASIFVIQTVAPAVCQGGCEPVERLGPLALYREGTLHGLALTGRLLAVETTALAVFMTTNPSDLFGALARLRVPYVANLMLSMTLRLIPILQREFAIVLAAQRSRGMRSTGFRAVIPSFVPVFAGAFERVRQLTIGLEARGFGGPGPRSSYRHVGVGRGDALAAVGALAAGAIGTVAGLTAWSAERVPTTLVPAPVVVGVFVLAATLLGVTIIVAVRSLARA